MHLPFALIDDECSPSTCSAESGIPTFRGAGGLWRRFAAQDLATPAAFEKDPSLVWQFYSYRRDVVMGAKPNPGKCTSINRVNCDPCLSISLRIALFAGPNISLMAFATTIPPLSLRSHPPTLLSYHTHYNLHPHHCTASAVTTNQIPFSAHYAIAHLQRECSLRGQKFTLLTQNIDRLHHAAGSTDVVELHGSLWLVKRVGEAGFLEQDGVVWEDRTQPLVPELMHCSPDADRPSPPIPIDRLPHRYGLHDPCLLRHVSL